MKNLQKIFVCLLLVALLLGAGTNVDAQTKFLTWLRERIGDREAKEAEKAKANKEWQEKFFRSPAAREDFATAVKKARCFTCHLKGEAKEVRNPFGGVLSECLQDELNMDTSAITAAIKSSAPEEQQQRVEKAFYQCFDKALQSPIDPDAGKTPTYRDRVTQGQLPYEQ